MVIIKDLSLAYTLPGRKITAALDNVDAEFAKEGFSVIIGPSGCGKTSLIRIMAGLLKPTEGTVTVEGIPVNGVRKNTAVIFQDYGLLPWKTVRANAELPLRFSGARRQTAVPDASQLLAQFGLNGFEKAYPRELSGGMQQRLAIVRALLTEPELLLMDEPFSSLDNFTREEAQDFFLSIRQKLRLTIIMVSHSIEEAVYLADTVYVMSGRNPGTMGHCMDISREKESRGSFRDSHRFHEYCTTLRKLLRNPTPA
jgi:NitT/TauT family transport system ATP-binding protein